VPVVLDGFIASSAALVAAAIAAGVKDYLVASHRSVEAGHRAIFEHLGLVPLFDLGMRLGEGTGAALAMQLIDDAVAIRDEMATFAEASVSGPAHD
jgi:nicotinate-nucleotide--dimethylbenzimidazole phosphoribosyltransferase